MRLIVCGGRKFSDKKLLEDMLDVIKPTTIIHGDASGADKIAGEYARRNGIEELKYPAEWEKHGKAAGPIRNQAMVKTSDADMLLAMPGGKGTDDMIKRANAKKIDLIIVPHPQSETGQLPLEFN